MGLPVLFDVLTMRIGAGGFEEYSGTTIWSTATRRPAAPVNLSQGPGPTNKTSCQRTVPYTRRQLQQSKMLHGANPNAQTVCHELVPRASSMIQPHLGVECHVPGTAVWA